MEAWSAGGPVPGAAGVGVLRCARARVVRTRDLVVDAARVARPAPCAAGRRDRSARRRGAAPRLARRAAHLRRGRVRRVPGTHAAPSGSEREPREPHRVMAQRPAHGRVHHPAGDGPPRTPRAHQRPRDGARLRSRHHRPAAVDRDGLHRERSRRAGRRPRVRDRAVRLRLVGPARARRRMGRDALAAARERRVA